MTSERLTIGVLLEGGLAQLRGKIVACLLFVAVDVLANYSVLWAESRYGLGLTLTLTAMVAIYAITSSLFIVVLGNALPHAIADPLELFVRVAFAIAVSLIATTAIIVGLILLIVPGLYLNARWFVSQPLVLLGGRGIIGGLRESWHLTGLSAWSLVGVTLVLFVPDAALSLFGSDDVVTNFMAPSLSLLAETTIGSVVSMFSLAIVVFAYSELASRSDWLAETFA